MVDGGRLDKYHGIEEDPENNKIFNTFNNGIDLKKHNEIYNDEQIRITLKIFYNRNEINLLENENKNCNKVQNKNNTPEKQVHTRNISFVIHYGHDEHVIFDIINDYHYNDN